MITQDDAERAVDWLRNNADNIAQARATRLYMEQWLKSQRALLQCQQQGMSAAASEAVALSHPDYLKSLSAFKDAVHRDEYMRWMATAAEAKIEYWRSQEATSRAIGRTG